MNYLKTVEMYLNVIYIDRPNTAILGGKYKTLDTFCYENFLAHYYILPNTYTVNDSQPTIWQEDLLENNHSSCNCPATIPLLSSKEKSKCRKVKAVFRYHVPNRHKYPEKYAHHLLFMYYPFPNEQDLKAFNSGMYTEKLTEAGILDIINANKQVFEPFGDLVDSALLHYAY